MDVIRNLLDIFTVLFFDIILVLYFLGQLAK